MSSILTTSHGIVLATAMAAVSGTVILFTFRFHKYSPPTRPCLSSSSVGKRERTKKKINKRVHFADDVVEPRGDGVEFRKRRHKRLSISSSSDPNKSSGEREEGSRVKGLMPANRVALYNGMLRDRGGHRLAYSC